MRHPYYGALATRDAPAGAWLIRRRFCLATLEARLRAGQSDGEILGDPRFASLRAQELAIVRYRVESANALLPSPTPLRPVPGALVRADPGGALAG